MSFDKNNIDNNDINTGLMKDNVINAVFWTQYIIKVSRKYYSKSNGIFQIFCSI